MCHSSTLAGEGLGEGGLQSAFFNQATVKESPATPLICIRQQATAAEAGCSSLSIANTIHRASSQFALATPLCLTFLTFPWLKVNLSSTLSTNTFSSLEICSLIGFFPNRFTGYTKTAYASGLVYSN